jgi:hypothetical protein
MGLETAPCTLRGGPMPSDLVPIPLGDQAWLGAPANDGASHRRGSCGHCSAMVVFAADGEPLGLWRNSPPPWWPVEDVVDVTDDG